MLSHTRVFLEEVEVFELPQYLFHVCLQALSVKYIISNSTSDKHDLTLSKDEYQMNINIFEAKP